MATTSLEQQVRQLTKQVERLTAHTGLSPDDWCPISKALPIMGIKRTSSWARARLERAKYADESGISCDLKRGTHWSHDGENWTLNANEKTAFALLNARLPVIPGDLGG